MQAYATCGMFSRVAKHMGVDQATLWRWRRDHPDFEAELNEAGERLTMQVAQLSRLRLLEYLESIGQMVVVEERDTRDSKGNAYTDVRRELVKAHPSMLRFGLTKLDPDLVRVPLTKDEQEQVRTYITEVLAARKEAERQPRFGKAA